MAQLIVKSSSFNDVIITGPNFTGSGNLTITGSLRSTGSVNLTLTNPPTTVSSLLIISSSGQVFSTASTAFTTSPGSPLDSIQYNSNGAFAGNSRLTIRNLGGGLLGLQFGDSVLATGYHSFAHGIQTTASGIASHTEGNGTKAFGPQSHAEGFFTETHANADYSHVSGLGTIASASGQIVVGQYNTQGNTSDYFVVGVGTLGNNRADGLGVNNTRTYISNSVYLPNLTNVLQDKIVMMDSAGQLFYAASESIKVTSASYALTASYAMNGGGGGGGTAGGPPRSIQFNSASAFSGSLDLVFDDNSNFVLYSSSFNNNPNSNYSIFMAGYGLEGDVYYSGNEGASYFGRSNQSRDLITDLVYTTFVVGNGVGGVRQNAIEVGINASNSQPYTKLPQLSNAFGGKIVSYNPGDSGSLSYCDLPTPGGNDYQIQYKTGTYTFGGVPGLNYSGSQLQNTGSLLSSGSTSIIGDLSVTATGSMILTGSSEIIGESLVTGSLSISGSEYILGSGSSVLKVDGTTGPLLTVNDTNTGSLFSVNDLSGMSILDVRSDTSVLIGSSMAPFLSTSKKLITTASQAFALGGTLIPTASYDGAFFEYMVKSGSNARSGYITATWSGSTIVSSSTVSTDIGSTSGLTTFVARSGSYIVLSGSANAADWTIKSIIRAI